MENDYQMFILLMIQLLIHSYLGNPLEGTLRCLDNFATNVGGIVNTGNNEALFVGQEYFPTYIYMRWKQLQT